MNKDMERKILDVLAQMDEQDAQEKDAMLSAAFVVAQQRERKGDA